VSRQTSAVLLLALLGGAGATAQAGPPAFSADVEILDTGGEPQGAAARLHAADHKTRIEIGGAADGFFLTDSDAGTARYVRSAQRIYLDARQSTPLTRIFIPVNPGDPCREWQTAAVSAGVVSSGKWHCELIERTAVNQREILEYRVVAPDRQPNYGWVDATIGFPIKWQAADGTMFVLKNIQFEPQPADLFSMPPDYRKLDPQALLERIKHSDVWAQ
jgi:hypothetical protein